MQKNLDGRNLEEQQGLYDNFVEQIQLIDQKKLEHLANLCVNVGLNLQQGQDLIITAPICALPLVRLVTAYAYKAGAGIVTSFFGDEISSLSRFRFGAEESFDKATPWLAEGIAQAFKNGAARLAIIGENPALLAHENPEYVARLNRANSTAYKPVMELITEFSTNWNIIAYPHVNWARMVFPDLDEGEAFKALGEAIFAASRINNDDPIAAWQAHNKALKARADWLNGQRFSALHFKSLGTDLKIGLAEDHQWHGGASKTRKGILCNPNIPTEEVFTTPHAHKVEGYVRSTKPLSYQGRVIEDIEVRFEKGRIVSAKASKSLESLEQLLATDEGASRLGEVALVPHSSPISKTGLLFYNTLFDENASCHIALGQCYRKCFLEGAISSPEDMIKKGGNQSLVHVDWMIGNADTDIDGLKENGDRVAIFRQGEWAQA